MYKYSGTKIMPNKICEHTQIALKAIFLGGCGVRIKMIMWGPYILVKIAEIYRFFMIPNRRLEQLQVAQAPLIPAAMPMGVV